MGEYETFLGCRLCGPKDNVTALYGSESWVLNTDMMQQLRSLHRRCCRGITRDFIHQDVENGEWICPNRSEEVLEKAGALTIEEYIQKRRDTIMPYTRSTNIYERCMSAKKMVECYQLF